MTDSTPTGPPDADVTPLAPGSSGDDAFVTGLLAALPRPTMPADVVARMDAALAALAHAPGASATASDPAADPAGAGSLPATSVAGSLPATATSVAAAADSSRDVAPVTPLAPRTGPSLPAPRRGRTALAALAGVAAVVVAASLATTAGLQGASAPTASDAAGAASPRPASVPSAPEGTLSAGFDGPLRVLMSGTAYESERLLNQVTRTLARLGLPTAGAADRSGSPAESTSRLAGCIHTLTGGDESPAVVDLASYEGRPATVLVIRDVPAGAGTVWVVGRDCDDDTASLITVRRISWPVAESGTAGGVMSSDSPDTPVTPGQSGPTATGGAVPANSGTPTGTDQPTTASDQPTTSGGAPASPAAPEPTTAQTGDAPGASPDAPVSSTGG